MWVGAVECVRAHTHTQYNVRVAGTLEFASGPTTGQNPYINNVNDCIFGDFLPEIILTT